MVGRSITYIDMKYRSRWTGNQLNGYCARAFTVFHELRIVQNNRDNNDNLVILRHCPMTCPIILDLTVFLPMTVL